jgi:hypothetical protein
MSTRANIIVKDKYDKLFFYRHSDGYPDGALPPLKIFMEWVRDGKIRNNVGQAAGWLVVLGAIEYNNIPGYKLDGEEQDSVRYGDLSTIEPKETPYGEPMEWKVGSIEPTTGLHGDVEYVYILDLDKQIIEVRQPEDRFKPTGAGKSSFWDKPALFKTDLIDTIDFSEKSKEVAAR